MEGSIDQAKPKSVGSASGVRQRGIASQFMENRGFGWLMEEEDLDEEDQRPLLYVINTPSFSQSRISVFTYITYIFNLWVPYLLAHKLRIFQSFHCAKLYHFRVE